MDESRTVIGVPLYNHAEHLDAALESLLGQATAGFALVLVDDRSDDGTADIARRWAARDPRVHFRSNDDRLGLVGNWRRCFELARELHPRAEYFAWASDHDLWEPRWLETLVAELDAHPEAVLGYPFTERFEGHKDVRWRKGFSTAGVASAADRLRRGCSSMYAGDMVYGLMRADALARCGVFRRVLGPDRLLMCELAMQGEFREVPDVLWRRRVTGSAERRRHRRAIFPRRAPLHTYLTPWMVHCAVLLWVYGVRGGGRPEIGRARGLTLAGAYTTAAIGYYSRRRLHKVNKRRKRARKRLQRRRKRLAGALRARVRPGAFRGAKRPKAARAAKPAKAPKPRKPARRLKAHRAPRDAGRSEPVAPRRLRLAPARPPLLRHLRRVVIEVHGLPV